MNALQGKDAFVSTNEPVAPAPEAADQKDKPVRRKRRGWLWLLLLAIIAAGAYVWFTQAPQAPVVEAADTEAQPAAPTVMRLSRLEVAEVALSDQRETVRITGTLRPARQASVSTRSPGTIEMVAVQPGDRVEQGQVIAELDTDELVLQREQQAASIEATRAQLTLAQSQLETARALVDRGSSPRSTLDSAQSNLDALIANLNAQEAQLATLDLNLANATIRAPFTGTVAERMVDPGQAVGAGTGVAMLVDTTVMEVVGNASLGDALDIEVGQEVIITVESLHNRSFAGTVGRISPVATEGTRTLPIFLNLENPGGVLRGGMFVTGQIVTSQAEDVLAVPSRAVLEDGEGSYVLVIEDDHLVRRDVETGRQWTSSRATEIVGGLEVGETIVAQELSGLAAGAPVVIEGN